MVLDIQNLIIQNILLLAGNEAITPSMLKFAKKNYEKVTGIKNNMSEMLNNHLNLDYLAKWMTRYSSGLATPITLSTYRLYKDK